jgi:hypothetical protein
MGAALVLGHDPGGDGAQASSAAMSWAASFNW